MSTHEIRRYCDHLCSRTPFLFLFRPPSTFVVFRLCLQRVKPQCTVFKDKGTLKALCKNSSPKYSGVLHKHQSVEKNVAGERTDGRMMSACAFTLILRGARDEFQSAGSTPCHSSQKQCSQITGKTSWVSLLRRYR
jgi:hypothetical protein